MFSPYSFPSFCVRFRTSRPIGQTIRASHPSPPSVYETNNAPSLMNSFPFYHTRNGLSIPFCKKISFLTQKIRLSTRFYREIHENFTEFSERKSVPRAFLKNALCRRKNASTMRKEPKARSSTAPGRRAASRDASAEKTSAERMSGSRPSPRRSPLLAWTGRRSRPWEERKRG